jgi:hypothetical protein
VAAYEEFDETRIKHMEMIQAVIARLAGNSFLMKGWAVTLTVAFLGFAVDKSDVGLAGAAFVPIVVFGVLDAYYLRAERLFRALYNRVRSSPESVKPFFMGATNDAFVAELTDNEKSWPKTIFSLTVLGFYALLALAAVLVLVIVC